MEVIQIIDATTKYLNFILDVRVVFMAVFLLVIGACLAFFSDDLRFYITGITAIVLGATIFFAGQCEMVEKPQTNYMIVCDDNTTVKEVMEKYHIIEQAGGALIVTDRDK